MFLTDSRNPLRGLSARARALNTWRDAEQLVSARWQTFLQAEPETRAWVFASYVAALDAEEAAAMEMAGLTSPAAKAA